MNPVRVRLTPTRLVGVAVVVALGVSGSTDVSAASPDPVLSASAVRFIPGGGAAIDDPVWVQGNGLLVTRWRHYVPSLASAGLGRGPFQTIPTLKLKGCGISPERFATRKGSHSIAYLVDCFRPGPSRLANPITGFGVLDLNTKRNRPFSTVSVPLGGTGRLTFSPNGTRAVLASGGLYSQLEWLSTHSLVRIRQGLAMADAPTWSPDGRLIVFAGIPPNAGDITTEPTNLYTFQPSKPQQLRLVAHGLLNFQPSGAAWMPGSSRWLIINLQPPHQAAGLWLLDVTTGRKALLLQGSKFGRPAVSPDGRTLAVGVGIDAEYRVDASGPVGLDLIRLPSLTRLRGAVR